MTLDRDLAEPVNEALLEEIVGDIEALSRRIDRVRSLLCEVRPILVARHSELKPLLTALGHEAFTDPRPPLTEYDLVDFEAAHGVRLPSDFRAFLAEVGNGGPGPGPGMSALSSPFPQTLLAPECPEPREVCQLITIASLGCGMAWLLVVSGPDAGNVWFHDEDGFVPSDPRCAFLDWYEGWLTETRQLGRVAPGPPLPSDRA
ncbi:MAG: SMI1/KNR4 family protein [Isosphaeraceae bacterium]